MSTTDDASAPAWLAMLDMPIEAKPSQRIRLTVPRRTTRAELQCFARQLAYYAGVGPKPEKEEAE